MSKKNENDFKQYFQGDVLIMRLPDSFNIVHDQEIKPENGRLILQEGEMTGHHHAINVMERPVSKSPPRFKDKALNDKFLDNQTEPPTARMFKGVKTAQDLVSKGVLSRSDLVVGLLEIDNGPMKVTHQEHDSIVLPPGKYVIGRQIESVAGEERRVAD